MKKKLLTVMISTVVSLSMIVTPVFAEHYKPGTNYPCNNTYTTYTHSGYLTSTGNGSHQLSDGRICINTRLIYLHKIACTMCGYAFSQSTALGCTESHSLCGTHIVNH